MEFTQEEMPSAEMEKGKNLILTKKDKSIDEFLFAVLETIREQLDGDFEEEDKFSEEYQKRFEEVATRKLMGMSIMLGNKLTGVLKNYLDQYYSAKSAPTFGRIRLPKQDLKSYSSDYGTCFKSWVNSPHVTYQCTNDIMLGNLGMLDCFVLHLWSFMVCYRTRGDNMFALSICGKSSVGKSVIFESVLFENGFQFNGESGVGRYEAKGKSVLMYHDINIKILANGKTDADKFKTISRGENTNAKVHSTVKTLPPLFVVVTSNMRVHTHNRRGPKSTNFLGDVYPSELCSGGGGRGGGTSNAKGANGTNVSEAVQAVKNRILEAYCSARPDINPACFPTSGCFRRKNFILGVYGYVLDLCEKYICTDFYSAAFLAYVLTGLSDQAEYYCRVMDDGECRMTQLRKVMKVLCPDASQRSLYLAKVPIFYISSEDEELPASQGHHSDCSSSSSSQSTTTQIPDSELAWNTQ